MRHTRVCGSVVIRHLLLALSGGATHGPARIIRGDVRHRCISTFGRLRLRARCWGRPLRVTDDWRWRPITIAACDNWSISRRLPDRVVVHDRRIIHHDTAFMAARRLIPPIVRPRMVALPDDDFPVAPIHVLIQPWANRAAGSEDDMETSRRRWPDENNFGTIYGHINDLRICRNDLDHSIFHDNHLLGSGS